MKLVTYYLEGVIKETKQFCVLEKVFSCDLQTSGVLGEFGIFAFCQNWLLSAQRFHC